jgi:hypothetical protein
VAHMPQLPATTSGRESPVKSFNNMTEMGTGWAI